MPTRKNLGGGKGQDKVWSDAIRIAALEHVKGRKGPKKLRGAATKLVDLALSGDMAAMKEMGDRLDGKAAQALVVAAEVTITTIERKIVDPRN